MNDAAAEANKLNPTEVSQERKEEAMEKFIPVSGKNPELVERLAKLPKPEVQMREVDFHFKTPRSEKKDKDGKPVDDLGRPLLKRPSVKLNIPYVTFDGLIEGLSDPSTKIPQYVLDIINDALIDEARVQVSDEANPVTSQDQLDLSKLTLSYLANQPKSERRGGGISKEVWEDFYKDYIEVMPAATTKSAEAVGNAAKLLLAKFQPVKTQKNIISYLQEQLALWFSTSAKAEELAECYDFLNKKAQALLAADEDALLLQL